MKYHIVRNDETVEDILFLYQISKKELREVNRHIKSFDKLIPGSRINIPSISESDDNDILSMEPFIEDYYPQTSSEVLEENVKMVSSDNIEENQKPEEKTEEKNEEKPKQDNKERRKKIDYYPYYYYDPMTGRYYVYYYPYAYKNY